MNILQKIIIGILTLFIFSYSCFAQNSRTKGNQENSISYLENQICIKLKKGVGEFEDQKGMVYFSIASLDEKVQLYEVYHLERRFKVNKEKAKLVKTDLTRIYKLSFSGDYPIQAVVNAFAKDSNVEYAEIIPVQFATEIPDDIQYDDCQHLPQIQAEDAWEIHKGEDGTDEIVIAIVDSGTDWTHEDLLDNVWQNLGEDADGDGVTIEFIDDEWVLDPDDLNGIDDDGNGYTDDLIGWDFWQDANADDGSNPDPAPHSDSHGTHCAGIAAASTNNGIGVASISYNVNYMPIKVDNGADFFTYAYDGIIYAAENGADIISNSWGGGPGTQANQEVINYAWELGSIIVAAAGNENNDAAFFPAHFFHVLSVASVSEDDTKAAYSSYQLSVDVSAPGGGSEGGILSSIIGDEYATYSGTSMACPLISGSLGLLKSYHPTWSNYALMNQVIGTSDEIDDLNTDYVNLMGSGRVNAYEMLAGELEDPYLKLSLVSVAPYDENGNQINEQGELIDIDFIIKNYMQTYAAEATISITSSDPDIIIIDGDGSVYVPEDSIFAIIDQFQIQVATDATPHFAELNLHFESDLDIVVGQDLPFTLLIAPSGIFVFEGQENGQDYSGMYISGVLEALGYDYIYSTIMPPTLIGFETAFLSFGNGGENVDQGTNLTEEFYLIQQEYLEEGNDLYMEMGGMFMGADFFEIPNAEEIKDLFGVDSVAQNYEDNPIDSLIGVEGSVMEGVVFSKSDQVYNWYIDDLTPTSDAIIPFYENDYGNTSIMYDGVDAYGQKAFYLSYALAALKDRTVSSSRNNVFVEVMEFFDFTLPEGYVLSNFIVDTINGGAPFEVHFTEISKSDPLYPVTSWQWDFENDGIIDSEEQHPSFTYTEGGLYDVRLIASNDIGSNTYIQEELIEVNSGYLVYDGDPDGADYSGEFIFNYLIDEGIEAHYRSEFPQILIGYEKVFLSYGNYNSGYTPLSDVMADKIIDYLNANGKVYLEGADPLGYDQGNNSTLHSLFGLTSVNDGDTNPIDSLVGQESSSVEGSIFTSNTQVSNSYIDIFTPNSNAEIAYIEEGYGVVAVQNLVDQGHRTFCFSYALSKLDDNGLHTKDELMSDILFFFDNTLGVDDVAPTDIHRCVIYPNPATNSSTLKYYLESADDITIEIVNSTGQKVVQLLNVRQEQGDQEYYWNTVNLPAGVYYYSLSSQYALSSGKIIIMK